MSLLEMLIIHADGRWHTSADNAVYITCPGKEQGVSASRLLMTTGR
jgi:hypothetical protein